MFQSHRSVRLAAMLIATFAVGGGADAKPPRSKAMTDTVPEKREIEPKDGGYIIVTAPIAAVRAARAAALPVGVNVRMDRDIVSGSAPRSQSVKP